MGSVMMVLILIMEMIFISIVMSLTTIMEIVMYWEEQQNEESSIGFQ